MWQPVTGKGTKEMSKRVVYGAQNEAYKWG